MSFFLVPLLLGFALNSASAFTATFCRRWGERRGRLTTAVLRNVLGIPLWVIGLGLAVRSPSPAFVSGQPLLEVLGWLLAGVGCVVIVLALAALRVRAAVPSSSDPLVQHGPYAHVRHPIYAAMFLEWVGVLLMKPTQAVALATALGIGWTVLQAKLEETDLLQRLPAYREYMSRVPRFIPHRRRRQG